MSNSLSIRDQNSFISAYKNLLNDSDNRIHKGDVNTLSRILNKCDKVEVGQLLMTKMESYPKDPVALKDTFSKLFDKLEAQNSKMHDKKEEKLKYIQQKLAPVVQDIHKNKINAYNTEINAYNAGINSEIKVLANDLYLIAKSINDTKNEITIFNECIDYAETQIKNLHNQIKPLADTLKNTSQEDFAAKDAQLLKNTEAKFSKLTAKQNTEISTLNKKIAANENIRAVLLDFAKSHGVSSAEQDLTEAQECCAYDTRDKEPRMNIWSKHLGSDEYAIKHFGYALEEGSHEDSNLIKVPSHEGKQWQKLKQNFDDAPRNIMALEKERSQLITKHKIDIENFKLKPRISVKLEIQQKINDKQKMIRLLEMELHQAKSNKETCHNYIPSLEARKSPLIAKMDELKSHIK